MTTISRLRNAVTALAERRPDHIASHFIVSPKLYARIVPPEMRGILSVMGSVAVMGYPVFPSDTLAADPGTIVLVAVERPKPSAI